MSKITKNFANSFHEILKNRKITIVGHDNIDVDSFLAGIMLSKLLTFLKVENEFGIFDEVIENDTHKILKELFDIDTNSLKKLSESSEREFVLVDHHETIHKGRVLAVIDHHPTSKELSCEFCYMKNSCAATYMVYELMELFEYPFTKEDVEKVVVAMLIDTISFKSTKTVEHEVKIAKDLSKAYEIDFEYLSKYALRITELESMTDSEIISNGEKWYSFKRTNDVVSSYVQVYDFPSSDTISKWLELIKDKLEETKADLFVFLIVDMKNDMTYEYQIMKKRKRYAVYNGILSRGKDIMPKVEMKILYS